MDIFRYSSNAYGQSTLEGISFELIYVFAGLAAVVIVAHFCYKLFNKND
ncbi:MAG: hypothetical protein P8J61_06305 [Gammaproteobacteria bacterium]|nr:hypothetical protein [Gammaproteobacteria bacterium]